MKQQEKYASSQEAKDAKMHFGGVDLNNDNVTTGERSDALYEDAEYRMYKQEKLEKKYEDEKHAEAAKHRFGEGAKAKTEAEHEAEADRIYKDGKQREAAKERKLKLEAEEREKALVTGRPDTTASQKKVTF